MKFRAIRSKSELYPQAITRQPDTRQPDTRQPYIRQPYTRQPYIRQPYIRQPYIRRPCRRYTRWQIYNNTELTFTAIKVEESKLDLNTEASSSFANVDHQTKSLIIEFENPGAAIVSEVNDPNHYCQTCQKQFASKYLYRQHLFNVHSVDLRSRSTATPNHAIVADVNDSSNYYTLCNKTYTDRSEYLQDLRNTHNMKTQHRATTPNSEIPPDPYDPNHYCRSCQREYNSRESYCRHLSRMHNLKVSQISNYHCRSCQKTYASKDLYRSHFEIVHPIITEGHSERSTLKLQRPIAHKAPGFMATTPLEFSALEPTRSYPGANNATSVGDHTEALMAFNVARLESDAGDPNNKTCKICQREYSCRHYYRCHMYRCHPNDTG